MVSENLGRKVSPASQLSGNATNTRQRIISGKIRKALRIRPGDTQEYVVAGDHATIRVHPGARSLKGALASKKDNGMSFAQIRGAVATTAVPAGGIN